MMSKFDDYSPVPINRKDESLNWFRRDKSWSRWVNRLPDGYKKLSAWSDIFHVREEHGQRFYYPKRDVSLLCKQYGTELYYELELFSISHPKYFFELRKTIFLKEELD